jgi:uncharacterized protein (DUF433 family)
VRLPFLLNGLWPGSPGDTLPEFRQAVNFSPLYQEVYLSMSLVETRYEHVILNEAQVPIIAGTNMKVVELVLERTAYGWSPEELHFQHPYLTLGQIYSALAYYWDHQEELDQDIERRLEFVDRVQRAMGPSPLVARLKAKGLI